MGDEVWKEISGYKGYEISNFGRVRTNNKVTYINGKERHWKNRILKQKTDIKGYKRVAIWKDGKPIDWLVHRLVARAFLEPVSGKEIVNHIDGNPSNNFVSNLEWTNHFGNLTHAYDHRLNKEAIPVILYDSQSGKTHRFRSYTQASEFLNKDHGYLSRKLKYKINVVDGYEVYTIPFWKI